MCIDVFIRNAYSLRYCAAFLKKCLHLQSTLADCIDLFLSCFTNNPIVDNDKKERKEIVYIIGNLNQT